MLPFHDCRPSRLEAGSGMGEQHHCQAAAPPSHMPTSLVRVRDKLTVAVADNALTDHRLVLCRSLLFSPPPLFLLLFLFLVLLILVLLILVLVLLVLVL